MHYEHPRWPLDVRSVPSFFSYFLDVRLSHTQSTHNVIWLIFTRALVGHQHSLQIRRACCTNATHIFVCTASAERSYTCLKYWTQTRRAVRTTSYQRQIRLLCVTWLHVELVGQSRAMRLPCAAWTPGAGAGYTRAVCLALKQQAVTVLFLQPNPFNPEITIVIFIHY